MVSVREGSNEYSLSKSSKQKSDSSAISSQLYHKGSKAQVIQSHNEYSQHGIIAIMLIVAKFHAMR